MMNVVVSKHKIYSHALYVCRELVIYIMIKCTTLQCSKRKSYVVLVIIHNAITHIIGQWVNNNHIRIHTVITRNSNCCAPRAYTVARAVVLRVANSVLLGISWCVVAWVSLAGQLPLWIMEPFLNRFIQKCDQLIDRCQ